MIVYRSKEDLVKHLLQQRKAGKCIGLVPTMGALHQGHASLVKRAVEECDLVVVSIFVNPTQFNDPKDLEHYPRTLDRDLEMLQKLEADVIFVPASEEMYPEKDERSFDLEPLDRVMEGASRAGHFNGVAQIVSKLFELIQPRRAYFGQKDFQQLAIIRRLVSIMGVPIQIISCPIIREKDGLALSSRNLRLNKEARRQAPFIYDTLQAAKEKRHDMSPPEIMAWVNEQFKEKPHFKLDYFELIDGETLVSLDRWDPAREAVGCIAAELGGIRLIDNLIFA